MSRLWTNVEFGAIANGCREVRVYGYKIVGLSKGIYFIGPTYVTT